MQITKHAEKRMKERCGLNKKSVERMAQRALDEGVKHGQTKGQLNKWITALYFKDRTANNVRLYGDYAFLFCGDRLITVIPIPQNLKKDLKKARIKYGERQSKS